jgi:MFS family permease
MDFSEAADY